VTGPLAGLRVVELGGIGPAPFAGGLLADLGADVLRVDRIPKAGIEPETPARFDFYNRNKRSVALDLKRRGAIDTVIAAAEKADALIEGFRPGVTERLGLGPQVCLAANPRLVYARMTGWGQEGPPAQEAGHDINYLALTGALHALGDADRPPPPPLNLIADLGGGALHLTVGILSAVLHARASGKGQTLDVAIVDCVTHLMSAFQAFRQQSAWTDKRTDNIADGGAPFYRCYETADGKYVAVGAIGPHFYAKISSLAWASTPPIYPIRTTARPGPRCASASSRCGRQGARPRRGRPHRARPFRRSERGTAGDASIDGVSPRRGRLRRIWRASEADAPPGSIRGALGGVRFPDVGAGGPPLSPGELRRHADPRRSGYRPQGRLRPSDLPRPQHVRPRLPGDPQTVCAAPTGSDRLHATRFAAPAFPGDTIRIEMFETPDGLRFRG
jgi:crotonobetainyl-CoA:carnitine CoA-transferase CaiB-like acyl-CoA transferase